MSTTATSPPHPPRCDTCPLWGRPARSGPDAASRDCTYYPPAASLMTLSATRPATAADDGCAAHPHFEGWQAAWVRANPYRVPEADGPTPDGPGDA